MLILANEPGARGAGVNKVLRKVQSPFPSEVGPRIIAVDSESSRVLFFLKLLLRYLGEKLPSLMLLAGERCPYCKWSRATIFPDFVSICYIRGCSFLDSP